VVHLYEGLAPLNVPLTRFPAELDGGDSRLEAAALTRGSGRTTLALLAPFLHFANLQGGLEMQVTKEYRESANADYVFSMQLALSKRSRIS